MRGLVFFLLIGTAAANEPTPWANKFFIKDNPPTVITHDFGTVPQGTMLVHKLKITNIYDVPMQIIDVRKSCTCLDATVPQQVLQPHETADITLVMNTAKFTGANAQSFFVTFGPQYVSTAVIKVSATSRPDVMLNPGQVNFGIVAPGSKPSQSVTVKYSGKQKDWKLTGTAAIQGPFDVAIKEGRSGILGLGSPEFTVTISLKDGATPGPINETISLKTNDPTSPAVQLSITGTVQAPVTASPGSISFGTVKVGSVVEKRVRLSAAKPFTASGVADTGDGLSIEAFPAPGTTSFVTIQFAPKAAGRVSKVMVIPTDLGPVSIAIDGDGQ